MPPTRPERFQPTISVVWAGAATAAAAVGLSKWIGTAAAWPLAVAIMVSALCQLIALPMRRLLVGNVRTLPKTRLLMTYLASRVALLVAVLILLLATAIVYAVGVAGRIVILRALLGLLLVMAATGMLGAAVINLAIVLRHRRNRERP
jgi:hypothetical protein